MHLWLIINRIRPEQLALLLLLCISDEFFGDKSATQARCIQLHSTLSKWKTMFDSDGEHVMFVLWAYTVFHYRSQSNRFRTKPCAYFFQSISHFLHWKKIKFRRYESPQTARLIEPENLPAIKICQLFPYSNFHSRADGTFRNSPNTHRGVASARPVKFPFTIS